MATGDHYVATLESHWGSDLTNVFANVFAYSGGSGSPVASDLSDAIATSLVSVLLPITATAVTYDRVTVINLDDPTDFAISIVGDAGSVSGQVLPKFNSWSFEYFRATRAVSNGRKAFPGVPESMSDNGLPADSTVVGLLDDVAEFLGADLDGVAPSTNYIPKIWRRAGTYSGGTFPDTFYAISAVGFKRISTQNTRKR